MIKAFVGFILLIVALHAQNGLERLDQSWKNVISRLDASWANSLKKGWVSQELEQAKKAEEAPKPPKFPVAETTTPVVTKIEPPVTLATLPVVQKPKPETIKPPAFDPNTVQIKVPLFDDTFALPYPKAISQLHIPATSPNEIGDFWGSLCALPHETSLAWLKIYQRQVLKSDWLFFQLITAFSREVFPKNSNAQVLYQWFLYTKLGYNTKLVYNSSGFYLLLETETPLYGLTFFTFNKTKFVLLTDGKQKTRLQGSVMTYPDTYPEAKQKIDLALKELPAVPNPAVEKILSFDYQHKTYAIPISFQANLSTYFEFLPQMDISLYGSAPLSEAAKASLYRALSPYLKKLSEPEAINFLLALTQKSFAYQTDQEQFGREKWFLPEETLFYPYSDCEDRAVFFAQLVRLTLGLEVVFLNYPGHMATAVKLTTGQGQDQVTYQNKQFTVCDPTYINASLGMAMPEFKKVTPKISEIH